MDRTYDTGGVLDGLGLRPDSRVVSIDPRSVANEVIKRLRDEGYDAFRKGGYHDISGKVWETIVAVLNEQRNQ